jgi:hypothetical protein
MGLWQKVTTEGASIGIGVVIADRRLLIEFSK